MKLDNERFTKKLVCRPDFQLEIHYAGVIKLGDHQ
jgi:hypothetical protein